MAITQVGYLGRTGPIFVDDSTVAGKKILLMGDVSARVLIAKQPAFVNNLIGSGNTGDRLFPGVAADFVLGPYSDGQTVGSIPAYKLPSTGDTFDFYTNVVAGWVDRPAITAPTTTTTGGGTTTTTGGGTTTTTGGGVVTTDTTFKAPTIGEQITTFLSNYWWLVLLVVGALLWKPVIAPALGIGKKKRYR